MAQNGIAAKIATLTGAVAGLSIVWGCATTEYPVEGPGQPTDRASGEVPPGSLGVCKLPLAKRPPIVNEKLWDDARICTPRTPERFIRLGYGAGIAGAATDEEAQKNMEKYLQTLRDGRKEEGGNNQIVSAIRSLHEQGMKDPMLRYRVARESARTSVCDYTYLLNTMSAQRQKLAQGNPCATQAYDPKQRTEVCLFDTTKEEAVWLTSSWSCVTHSGAMGEETSCFRMCAYDEYCAKQVSCTAPDVDLLLCAMGVCLPEERVGGR